MEDGVKLEGVKMTEGVPDEVIKEWAKKHYPEYADNLKVMRILYERAHGRGVKASYSGYEAKDISEVNEGEFVEVKGVVFDEVRIIKYDGCPECYRKECNCGKGKVTYYRPILRMADKTGDIMIALPFATEMHDVKIGDEIVVKGRVKRWKDIYEINVREYEVVKKKDVTNQEAIEEALRALDSAGEMEKGAFIKYIDRKWGLTWDDIKGRVDVLRYGKEEWVRVRE